MVTEEVDGVTFYYEDGELVGMEPMQAYI